MKTISKTALVALMAASVGLTGIATTAFAQNAPTPQVEAPGKPGEGPQRFQRQGPGGHDGIGERRIILHHAGGQWGPGGPGGPGPRGGGFGLLNFGNAEALEIALVRLSYAVDLTEEQRALFEDLKSEALAAQADFAEATEDLRFDPRSGGERPDIVELYGNRIAVETARLEALQAVQPAFSAFFNSLTDEQKAELGPRHARFERPGQPGGPGAPQAPAPAEAPEAPVEG